MSKRDKKLLKEKYRQQRRALEEKRLDEMLARMPEPVPAARPAAVAAHVPTGSAVQTATPSARKPDPEPVSESDEVYTVPEMCRLLKVSRATLDRECAKGHVPGRFKFGNQVRFHGPTVRAFLAQQAAQALNPQSIAMGVIL